VTIRRNVITDAWSAVAHSQGVYIDGIATLEIDDNLFDHNGWNSAIAGGGDTVFNHNAYIKESITNFVATIISLPTLPVMDFRREAAVMSLTTFFSTIPLV